METNLGALFACGRQSADYGSPLDDLCVFDGAAKQSAQGKKLCQCVGFGLHAASLIAQIPSAKVTKVPAPGLPVIVVIIDASPRWSQENRG